MLLIILSQHEYHWSYVNEYYNFSLMLPIRINNFRGTKIVRKMLIVIIYISFFLNLYVVSKI